MKITSSTTPLVATLALLIGAKLVSAQTPAGTARAGGTAMLVGLPSEAAWQDFAFLAAVAASSKANEGIPLVLATSMDGTLPPEIVNFLARRNPGRIVRVGGAGQEDPTATQLEASNAVAAACVLSRSFFDQSAFVVSCADDDYSGALAGAVIAAREGAPLLVAQGARLPEATRAEVARLGAKKVLYVGSLAVAGKELAGASCERLVEPTEAARWLQARGRTVDYLAVAAPADRAMGLRRKLSLSAAVLAAGRKGAIGLLGTSDEVTTDFDAARGDIATSLGPLANGLEHLCLAAGPDMIPMAVVAGTGAGIDTDPPSDLEYGNIDADPFVELAVGRFVAEDAAAGALLAARSLAYEHLFAPKAGGTLALAEWERAWAPLFANVGFAKPTLHEGGKPFTQDSPLASATAIVHSAHSSWLQLGETYMHDSRVLLAPCLVETGGCSPAALDSDPQQRSVALRLLRNGAVGFVGSVRRAVAQHELYRTEFWNAVLAGRSLGQANRHALNRALVACLARDEDKRAVLRYQLLNAAFYGDPALVLHLPSKPRTRTASAEIRGREVVVRAPAEWSRVEHYAPPDWKYEASPAIHGWRGAGVGVESSWDAANRRNHEVLVYTAEVRTERAVTGLTALDQPAAPTGWDGRYFVDEHPDGTRSVYFRVQLVDFDMSTGKVREKLERLRLRLQ